MWECRETASARKVVAKEREPKGWPRKRTPVVISAVKGGVEPGTRLSM